MSSFSGDSTDDAYHEYHQDPYYYYPRTPGPPVQMGGYYRTPSPQYYQQPHYEHSYYEQPYYDQSPRYIPAAVRPEYHRASGLRSFLTIIVILSVILFAAKAEGLSLTISFDSGQRTENKSMDIRNNRTYPGQPRYSQDANTYALNTKNQ